MINLDGLIPALVAVGAIGASIVWGVVTLFSYFFFIGSDLEEQAKQAIEQCEVNLPRNQHCKITAVVAEGE